MKCGYFVSVKKSVLQPTQKLIHLGFEVDSVTSSFAVPERKREIQGVARDDFEGWSGNVEYNAEVCGQLPKFESGFSSIILVHKPVLFDLEEFSGRIGDSFGACSFGGNCLLAICRLYDHAYTMEKGTTCFNFLVR
jgi:hypothetical protein